MIERFRAVRVRALAADIVVGALTQDNLLSTQVYWRIQCW